MTKLADLLRKSAASPGFLKLWAVTTNEFGPKGNKQEAHDVWVLRGLEGCEDELIPLYLAQVRAKQAELAAGREPQYFKHICRWLKYSCWEDELPAPAKSSPIPQSPVEIRATFKVLKDQRGEAFARAWADEQ